MRAQIGLLCLQSLKPLLRPSPFSQRPRQKSVQDRVVVDMTCILLFLVFSNHFRREVKRHHLE